MAVVMPDKLRLDATVPLSLDNQFVPDKLLRKMVRENKDFNSLDVKDERARRARAEFMRALIYTEQIVINSAFFVNTPFLFELYDTPARAAEFRHLLQDEAIVPFVVGEDVLVERDFETHAEGAKALNGLLNSHSLKTHLKRVTMLRANERLGAHFTDLVAGLVNIEARGCRWLLAEMGAAAARLSNQLPDFQRLLQELGQMACEARAQNKSILRNDIYKQFFSAAGTDNPVANGRFSPRLVASPAVMWLKLLVDAAYNFNLSDHLDRASLTPPGSPGRASVGVARALTGVPAPNEAAAVLIPSSDEERLVEAASRINQKYMDKAIEVQLPRLDRISVKDVVHMRSSLTWRKFIKSKRQLMQTPKAGSLIEFFDEFVQRHKEFHEEIVRNTTWRIPTEGLTRVSHVVENPWLKKIPEVLGDLDVLSEEQAQALELGLEAIEPLTFTVESVNEKVPALRSSIAFWGTRKLRKRSREELMRMAKELAALRRTNQAPRSARVEQSKA